MEEQQQRHMKEVYMDSAFKPLASNLDNESISNLSFKSAYTQDTNTQRIKEMLTKASDSRKANAKNGNAEYYDLDMEPQLELESSASSDSGHGQVDISNHIHVEDYLGSIRNIENDYRLKELEAERRMQEINENKKVMFKAELHKIQGQSEIQNIQQNVMI